MVSSGDYTGTSDFCHLNVHTVFSPLIGVASPDNYAKQCKRNGQLAIAATEHGNMASVPDMHFACKKNGIKYIPGCELHWNDYEPERKKHYTEGLNDLKRTNEDLFTRIMRNRTLTVLCKNDVGFHNLVKLTTLATKHGFFHMPRVWFEELVKYKEGLIILSGGMNGPIAHELYLDIDGKEIEGARHDRSNISKTDGSKLDLSAVGYSKKFKKEFGDDFYIEIQMPCMPEIYDNKIFRAQILLADKLGIQLVLTNSCYYLNSEDIEIQRIMVAIAQKTHIDDPNLVFRDTDQQWLKSRAELWATFKNNKYSTNVSDETFETICDNTLKVAQKCEGLKPDTSPKIPDWGVIEKGEDADQTLRKTVAKELVKRGLHKIKKKYNVDGRDVTYVEQSKIECDRFIDKGFASYFLITQDIIGFGKKKGWPFGPRGCSVPDSIVVMGDGASRRIIDVEVGDFVLDGFGDKQIVENKFVYDVSEDLIEVELEDGVVLSITADHKLYVVRGGRVILIKAGELKDIDEIINACSD